MLHAKYIGWLKNNKKRKTHINAEDTYFRSKDTQAESEGMEKGIPCKWK